jgi:hypothetical protein
MEHYNWWGSLSEKQKENVWYNEVVSPWWGNLNLSDKMSISTKEIGTIDFNKVTKEQKIKLYKDGITNTTNFSKVPKLQRVQECELSEKG